MEAPGQGGFRRGPEGAGPVGVNRPEVGARIDRDVLVVFTYRGDQIKLQSLSESGTVLAHDRGELEIEAEVKVSDAFLAIEHGVVQAVIHIQPSDHRQDCTESPVTAHRAADALVDRLQGGGIDLDLGFG
ncbi:hypothetical protein D3C71_1428060 [compost metagenome]